MKKMILLALCCCSVQMALAQQPASNAGKAGAAPAGQQAPRGNARITGQIIDAGTRQPIEFATVALLPLSGEKPIDGAICDDKGKFELLNLAPGKYRLQVSFIGYQSQVVPDISLENNVSDRNLGQIALKADDRNLSEVTIVGERELFENKIDRLVYNAEKDIGNSGGNAADVLKKVPQVTVDLEGNVQLRGSSNIRVLINNKPSSIMAASVADALKQIPSDMIKSVEVITSPSAKFDAEGTAGIINIITKKNNLQGVNGSVWLTYGNISRNVGASVNRRQGKLGLNTNLGTNDWGVRGDAVTVRNDFSGGRTNTLNQQSDFRNGGRYNYIQFGADYDFDPKNTMNASLRVNNSDFRNQNELTSAYSGADLVTRKNYRDIDTRNDNTSVDVNLGYSRFFAKPQQELSLLALYSRSARTSLYDLNETDQAGTSIYRERNPNDNINEEITFQADYVHPVTDKQVLEAGAKGILRNVSSDYQFFSNNGEGAFVLNPQRSDLFGYDQDVAATYLSYGFGLGKKYSLKVGSRYEHTFINADFKSSNTGFSDDYGNFIPNLMVARDLSETDKLKASYSRRIQRPLIFYLNPYVNTADSLNVSFGNPNLEPELTNAYELSYSTFMKAGSVTASLYWRQTNNAIETVRFVEQGIASTTYQNIAKNNTVGLSLFGSVKLFEKFSLSGNTNVFYMQLNSTALDQTNSNIQANFNLNASYKFSKGWYAEAFGFYNTPRVQLQGKVSGMRYYNFAAKKEILKQKGSISVGLDNIFERATPIRTTYETPTANQITDMNFQRRGIRISFNYRFGKMEFNNARRKKSIRNDDVKGGEGNSQGQ